ncbi:aerotolerance regulator BatC [Lacinutrix neustonica]|uniref:Aerotolerance regulator BatC n=1 Tax=Lacinutrix neustonica TaxID=2980107 RepID=A0A9E8MSY8_9FLAO|nr:tetratricopeptide repeat protein [Lacinutrix neustonica]WAC00892.1 aerotolerance regulator BatC [Lacinutrix neustonica]
MKQIITYIFILIAGLSFAQEAALEKQQSKITKRANDLIHEANDLASNDDFVLAEMEYRKAISTQPTSVAGTYNLGHSYYKKGNYDEALYRNQQAAKNATNKEEKHRAFHNIGNILMQNKKCKQAVEAFKNALRNDPTDDETRYNLALAKDCAKDEKEPPQEKDNKDDNKDNQEDDNKENEDKKDKEQEDQKDKGGEGENEDKKEGEDKEDEGKPDDKKEKDGEGGDNKKEQPKPQQQPGQLSAQQIKNLLEAMNNQEQKVQEKMNAEKVKGVKVQTDKDW